MSSRLNQLFHPAFLFALFLLILNDAFLKWQYPSWITGKLSDFAGLFAFAFFFSHLFPRKKSSIFLLIGLMFCWWKSPYSQFFIYYWNTLGLFPIKRVIDYTDLIALIILPIGYHIPFKKVRFNYPAFIKLSLFSITIIAFTATSMPRKIITPEGHVAINKAYYVKKNKDEIFRILDSLNFEYIQDSILMKVYGFTDNSGFLDTLVDSSGHGRLIETDYLHFFRLQNVQFEKTPLLKDISFSIYQYSDKDECMLRFYSITFDVKPHRLDNWKKLKRLRKYYKKLLKKNIIKELKK